MSQVYERLRRIRASLFLVFACGFAAWLPAEDIVVVLSDPKSLETDVKYVGANVQEAATQDAQGILLKLPTGKEGRPQVGVQSKFWIENDFVVTADYEIISTSVPSTGYGSGVILKLEQESSRHQRIMVSRFRHHKRGDVFSSNFATDEGRGVNDEKFSKATSASGSLRVERQGKIYRVLVKDGDSEFVLIRTMESEAASVKKVSFLADTGGAPEVLEVRLKKLTVSSDTTKRSRFVPKKTSSLASTVRMIVTGMILLAGLAWLIVSRRSRPPLTPPFK